jgi:Family of unknown function (DUF6186)
VDGLGPARLRPVVGEAPPRDERERRCAQHPPSTAGPAHDERRGREVGEARPGVDGLGQPAAPDDLAVRAAHADGRLVRMAVQLNHTIVNARDSETSAAYVAELLGLPAPSRYGPFQVVEVANGVSLDFMDADGDITPQHYAFLVTEAEFDEIFGRITARAAPVLDGRRRRRPRWRAGGDDPRPGPASSAAGGEGRDRRRPGPVGRGRRCSRCLAARRLGLRTPERPPDAQLAGQRRPGPPPCAGRRRPDGPTAGGVLAVLLRHPAAQLLAVAAWLWVGWHLFVRASR